MFYRQKNKGGVSLQHMKYVIANRKLHRPFTLFDNSMKFGIVIVHIIKKDMSYDTKVNKSKISHCFGVKYSNSVLKCLIYFNNDPSFLQYSLKF